MSREFSGAAAVRAVAACSRPRQKRALAMQNRPNWKGLAGFRACLHGPTALHNGGNLGGKSTGPDRLWGLTHPTS